MQAFVQGVGTLAVHLERDLELQVAYFIGDHQLEDATAMFLLGPGVHLGAVEEHGRRILELVISDEIANMELEIALQMYREPVDRLDERLHEFRQSQELP